MIEIIDEIDQKNLAQWIDGKKNGTKMEPESIKEEKVQS